MWHNRPFVVTHFHLLCKASVGLPSFPPYNTKQHQHSSILFPTANREKDNIVVIPCFQNLTLCVCGILKNPLIKSNLGTCSSFLSSLDGILKYKLSSHKKWKHTALFLKTTWKFQWKIFPFLFIICLKKIYLKKIHIYPNRTATERILIVLICKRTMNNIFLLYGYKTLNWNGLNVASKQRIMTTMVESFVSVNQTFLLEFVFVEITRCVLHHRKLPPRFVAR